MIADATAVTLARDLVVYREMLSVALEQLGVAQRHIAARERVIVALREDLQRYTREQVEG